MENKNIQCFLIKDMTIAIELDMLLFSTQHLHPSSMPVKGNGAAAYLLNLLIFLRFQMRMHSVSRVDFQELLFVEGAASNM